MWLNRIGASGGSTCKPVWSQDHPDLEKNVCIYIYIYICQKKSYAKLTYCDYLNKKFETYVLQKFGFNKNKSSASTFTAFSQ